MRVHSLDGLRGFALIMVMIFHTFMPFTQGGFLGVDVFFVLSGFLITTLLLEEYEKYQTIRFKKFYMRRFLRLAPALILMVISFYIYTQVFMDGDKKEGALAASVASLFYVANLAIAFDWFSMSFLRPTWSLSIEEQFYIIWPITLLALLFNFKRHKYFIFILLSSIILLWANRIFLTLNGASIDRLYNGSDTHSDGLLVGSLFAYLITYYKSEALKILRYIGSLKLVLTLAVIGFYIAVTLLLGLSLKSLYIWILPIFYILTAIFISFLYLQANTEKIILFSNKYLIWLGSISYGVYLWHWLVNRVFVLSVTEVSGIYASLLSYVIAILIAVLSFYFVEKPFLKLKKKFY